MTSNHGPAPSLWCCMPSDSPARPYHSPEAKASPTSSPTQSPGRESSSNPPRASKRSNSSAPCRPPSSPLIHKATASLNPFPPQPQHHGVSAPILHRRPTQLQPRLDSDPPPPRPRRSNRKPPLLIPACRALHASLLYLFPPLQPLHHPPCIPARTDRWAYADRYAWGELIPPYSLPANIPAPTNINLPLLTSILQPLLNRLQALLTPLTDLDRDRDPAVRQRQVIHGDLTGNLLFCGAPDEETCPPPAIIDFSPLYRPAAYAEAIVAADLLLWRKGDVQDLRSLDVSPGLLGSRGRVQLLVRAVLFRLVTFAIDSDNAEGRGFVERNLPLLDGEGAVSAVEGLVREMEMEG